MSFKNLKPNKSKKNSKFKDNDFDSGFPKMKAPVKGKEKVTKGKWKDYEIQDENEDDE